MENQNVATLHTEGSTIENLHIRRNARVYAIFENELESLGLLNVIANGAFSFAAACLSFTFALYLEAQLSPEASPQGAVLLSAGPVVGAVLALFSSLVAYLAWRKRGSVIQKIKNEAQELDLKSARLSG